MNYALDNLRKVLLRAKGGERVYYSPYMIGGSGHVCSVEEIQIMEELITLGSDVNIDGMVNKYSDTPLHLAYVHKNQPMIDFLIKHGANEQAKRYDGRIPKDFDVPFSIGDDFCEKSDDPDKYFFEKYIGHAISLNRLLNIVFFSAGILGGVVIDYYYL